MLHWVVGDRRRSTEWENKKRGRRGFGIRNLEEAFRLYLDVYKWYKKSDRPKW